MDNTQVPQAESESITDVEVVEGQEALKDVQPMQFTPQQIQAILREMKRAHNAKCRKKGFKDHFHQPAGNKLKRKLARQGSLYGGRVSLVSQMFKDVQEQAWKVKKENEALKASEQQITA